MMTKKNHFNYQTIKNKTTMAKLDYKKLWEQQKRENALICTENKELYKQLEVVISNASKFESQYLYESENAKSWEHLRSVKQGEAEGIMRCFKELLNNKNQE